MTLTLYGIPNCDTIKKARKWLEAAGIDYTFHDFRKDGLQEVQVAAWADELEETARPRRAGTGQPERWLMRAWPVGLL